MSLLKLTLIPGEPILDQVVFAAIRAFADGTLPPGTPFPSVRALAADLKVHPNTALKVVQHLIREGWIESRPGIGTIVAARPPIAKNERARLLRENAERLVVQAKSSGLTVDDAIDAVRSEWHRLEGSASDDHRRTRAR